MAQSVSWVCDAIAEYVMSMLNKKPYLRMKTIPSIDESNNMFNVLNGLIKYTRPQRLLIHYICVYIYIYEFMYSNLNLHIYISISLCLYIYIYVRV